MTRLLLHACCGPCAEYPVASLLLEGFRPDLYYFNPNIHPAAEWKRRWDALQQLAKRMDLTLWSEGKSEPEIWIDLQRQSTGNSRCTRCYKIRLEQTAKKAAELGYDAFTTTLLISPYQDFERLMEIGQQAADRFGVAFLDRDFRPGFRQSQNMAREDGLYRQKYCGCILSLEQSDFKEKILNDHSTLLDD